MMQLNNDSYAEIMTGDPRWDNINGRIPAEVFLCRSRPVRHFAGSSKAMSKLNRAQGARMERRERPLS